MAVDHVHVTTGGATTTEEEFERKATRAVRAVVMGELEDAYAEFHANPGGAGFGRLQEAMYAAQMVAQAYGKTYIVQTLADVPVADWLPTIAKHVHERLES